MMREETLYQMGVDELDRPFGEAVSDFFVDQQAHIPAELVQSQGIVFDIGGRDLLVSAPGQDQQRPRRLREVGLGRSAPQLRGRAFTAEQELFHHLLTLHHLG